jgi:hypothetical protein
MSFSFLEGLVMSINSSPSSIPPILHYRPEEFAEKGSRFYSQTIFPMLGLEADGKIVAITYGRLTPTTLKQVSLN